MAEETTLALIKMFHADAGTARAKLEEANEKIHALAGFTRANIDGLVVGLVADGRVAVAIQGKNDSDFVFSERQFLGLMEWGRKHVGEGPNTKDGKAKE